VATPRKTQVFSVLTTKKYPSVKEHYKGAISM